MNHELIIVLDFGSPYNQLIARRIRALKVFCQVLPFDTPIEAIREKNPKGIVILPRPGSDVTTLDFNKDISSMGTPVLDGISWDTADISDEQGKILETFLFETCNVRADWDMKDYALDAINELKKSIGGKKVLCALSGGVDSTVAAFMVHKAVGDNLVCVFVDTGLMRLNEGDEVEQAFKQFKINFIRVNASDRFLGKLEGISDPEQKRKIIGEEFIRVFEDESRKIGTVDYLVQGTIYPDIIESGVNNSANIKSHHNVGGLPDVIDFKELVEPLKDLFKDEVRNVGLALGIPEYLIFRQPFPGPGLAVRCIGEITMEKLDILRSTDFILRDEIKKAGLDRTIWQYFTVLTGLRSVGVKNEKRTYGYTIAIRAINTVDAMTADWIRIPYDVLNNISTRIVTEVDDVSRIVYDITSKPPATIEWE